MGLAYNSSVDNSLFTLLDAKKMSTTSQTASPF